MEFQLIWKNSFTPFWTNSVLHYLCSQCLSFYIIWLDDRYFTARCSWCHASGQCFTARCSWCHASEQCFTSAELCFISEWLPFHITWQQAWHNLVNIVSATQSISHYLVNTVSVTQHFTLSGEHCQCNTAFHTIWWTLSVQHRAFHTIWWTLSVQHRAFHTIWWTLSVKQSISHYLMNTVSVTEHFTLSDEHCQCNTVCHKVSPVHVLPEQCSAASCECCTTLSSMKNVLQHPVNVTSHCLSSMKRVPQHPVNVTPHCLIEFHEQSSTASCECYITLSDWVPWTEFHSILWMLHHTVWLSSVNTVPQHPVNVTSHCLSSMKRVPHHVMIKAPHWTEFYFVAD